MSSSACQGVDVEDTLLAAFRTLLAVLLAALVLGFRGHGFWALLVVGFGWVCWAAAAADFLRDRQLRSKECKSKPSAQLIVGPGILGLICLLGVTWLALKELRHED